MVWVCLSVSSWYIRVKLLSGQVGTSTLLLSQTPRYSKFLYSLAGLHTSELLHLSTKTGMSDFSFAYKISWKTRHCLVWSALYPCQSLNEYIWNLLWFIQECLYIFHVGLNMSIHFNIPATHFTQCWSLHFKTKRLIFWVWFVYIYIYIYISFCVYSFFLKFAANAFLFMLILFLNKISWKRTSYRICDSIANPPQKKKGGGGVISLYIGSWFYSEIMESCPRWLFICIVVCKRLGTASKCRPHIYSGKIASIC